MYQIHIRKNSIHITHWIELDQEQTYYSLEIPEKKGKSITKYYRAAHATLGVIEEKAHVNIIITQTKYNYNWLEPKWFVDMKERWRLLSLVNIEFLSVSKYMCDVESIDQL